MAHTELINMACKTRFENQKLTKQSWRSSWGPLPEPNKNAKRSVPVDFITLRKSALNNSIGTANGSKNSKTIGKAGASDAMIPKLLAASPTNALTRAPLNALPTFVFSDLQFQESNNKKENQRERKKTRTSFQSIAYTLKNQN